MSAADPSTPAREEAGSQCGGTRGRRVRRLNTAPPASNGLLCDGAAAAKEESAPEATPEVPPAQWGIRTSARWGSMPVSSFGNDSNSGQDGDRILADGADGAEKGPPRRRSLRRSSTDPRGAVMEGAKNETLSLLEAGLRHVSPQGADGLARHVSMEGPFDDGAASLPPGGQPLAKPRRQSRAASLDAEALSSAGTTIGTTLLEPESPAVHWLVPQLLFALTLGALLGAATVFFHVSTAKVEDYLQRAARGLADASKALDAAAGGGVAARAVFGAYMAGFTFLAAALVSWVSQRLAPECVGGGTIATKICLAVGSPVPLRVGAWRFVLSALYVGAGNVLGIEAPTLHLCAAVASALHRLACRISERVLRCASAEVQLSLFTDEGLPQAVVLGCAAGLSAAFGSPLAAISYAVEEYVDVRQTGMVTALVLLSSLSAALVSRGLQPHTGPGSLSISARGAAAPSGGGGPAPSPAPPPPAGSGTSTNILPWLLVATVVGLALGTLSHVVMTGVLRLRAACQARCNVGLEIGFGALAGLVTGALSCAVYVATACDSAWGLGRLGARSRLDPSCDAMQGGDADASIGSQALVSLLLSASKLIAFGVCFATGGAGGVLMPSLVIGTSLGRCAGLVSASMDSALPAAGPVLGMAAFFAANMRLPLTAAGVAMECATAMGNYDPRLVCTIPLASALGTWVAAWWDPCSIFERMMMQDGINPFTLSQQIQVMLHGTDGPGQIGSDRPQNQQRRDSRTSLVPGPLAPPALHTDSRYGESQASARIVMAARRRSILTEFRTEPNNSFISSPDEVLFASASANAPRGRAHPQHRGVLAILPTAFSKKAKVSPQPPDVGDPSALTTSLFPGVGSHRGSVGSCRGSWASSSGLSDVSEVHPGRPSVQECAPRPSGRSTRSTLAVPGAAGRQPSGRGGSQHRQASFAAVPSRTDTPDSVSELCGPTLLGCAQSDPKPHSHP